MSKKTVFVAVAIICVSNSNAMTEEVKQAFARRIKAEVGRIEQGNKRFRRVSRDQKEAHLVDVRYQNARNVRCALRTVDVNGDCVYRSNEFIHITVPDEEDAKTMQYILSRASQELQDKVEAMKICQHRVNVDMPQEIILVGPPGRAKQDLLCAIAWALERPAYVIEASQWQSIDSFHCVNEGLWAVILDKDLDTMDQPSAAWIVQECRAKNNVLLLTALSRPDKMPHIMEICRGNFVRMKEFDNDTDNILLIRRAIEERMGGKLDRGLASRIEKMTRNFSLEQTRNFVVNVRLYAMVRVRSPKKRGSRDVGVITPKDVEIILDNMEQEARMLGWGQ